MTQQQKPPVMYLHLQYEEYKALEQQFRAFAETTHETTPGPFYHKSMRVNAGGLIIEFHGPLVAGVGHHNDNGSLMK